LRPVRRGIEERTERVDLVGHRHEMERAPGVGAFSPDLELAERPRLGRHGLNELVRPHLTGAGRVVAEVAPLDHRVELLVAVEVHVLEGGGAGIQGGLVGQIGPRLNELLAAADPLVLVWILQGRLEDEEVAIGADRSAGFFRVDDSVLPAVRAVLRGQVESHEETDRSVGAGARGGERIARGLGAFRRRRAARVGIAVQQRLSFAVGHVVAVRPASAESRVLCIPPLLEQFERRQARKLARRDDAIHHPL
jgi:hypothetical protein